MPGPAASTITWNEIDNKICAILRGVMLVSLQPSDGRKENQDALELRSEALLRILSRLNACREDPRLTPILDPLDFAAKIAYNVYYDYVRKKNPAFSSLKNALLYFFNHESGYAAWQDTDGTILVGRRVWLNRPIQEGYIRHLEEVAGDPERFFRAGAPAFAPHMRRAQWKSLVDPFLQATGGPVTVNDLVKAIASACAMDISIKREEEQVDVAQISTKQSDTDEWVIYLATLRRLWLELNKLDGRLRQVFLLNPPRGTELDVFPEHHIASVEEIVAAVGLNDQQYATVWSRLELTTADRARLSESDTRTPHILWKYLPLKDAIIAALLAITQQQVINLRMLAIRRLKVALRAFW